MATVGLGLAALGRPGYINVGHAQDLGADYGPAAMERRCHAVLDAAWQAGVRWFDAARSYGRAEEFLADWLRAREIAPGAATVSSKWGYTYTAGWRVTAEHHEVKDHSLAALERQLGESRALLGAHLSLYQVHSATLESGVLDNRDVLARLGALRDGGLPVGLTLSGPRQRETLERALGVVVGGAPLWSTVQATWNLCERAVEPALRAAKQAGLRVIAKEVLANGWAHVARRAAGVARRGGAARRRRRCRRDRRGAGAAVHRRRLVRRRDARAAARQPARRRRRRHRGGGGAGVARRAARAILVRPRAAAVELIRRAGRRPGS
jgi:aryl-alcohol dehydrogenase-like predicted oxidoreductase